MDARVEAVIDLMHQSGGIQFSMCDLSRRVNLFKRDTGLSPLQYLRDLRIKEAERLLRLTFLSVKEVACLTASKDVSHFVRDFKKQYGVTPSEFRTRNHASRKLA
jgi:transcriptional regulator GlxA family with amidase domain